MKLQTIAYDRRTMMQWLSKAAVLASCAPTRAVAGVKSQFSGRSVSLGEPGYETTRAKLVWQSLKPKRYPYRISEARSADDVVAILAEARASGRRVSIVGGGHSFVGNGVRDNTEVVVTAALNELIIDSARSVAHAGPGVLGSELDHASAAVGLAFPVGHSALVRLGGYLLGGGMGWNADAWGGLACFNIRAVDVVLASGAQLRADKEKHSELLWAARGAGPNFPGVVTNFELDLFPRPAAIMGSVYIYSIESAAGVFDWLDAVHPALSGKMDLTVVLGSAENGPGRTCTVSAGIFADSEAEAREIHRSFVRGRPVNGTIFLSEMSPKTIQSLMSGASVERPTRAAVESSWTNAPRDAANIALRAIQAAPSAQSMILLNYRSRSTLPRSAAASRFGRAFFVASALWNDPADDEANLRWLDGVFEEIRPISTGCYVNESEFVRHPERMVACYGEEHWRRLSEIVRRYDPAGLFVNAVHPQ